MMNVEYHRLFSPNLGHDMEFKIYGNRGKPVLAFPAQNGRFYDWENFGMVEAIRPLIESGQVQLFTVDGIDWQSWTNKEVHPADRVKRHNAYDRYIVDEIVPLIFDHSGQQTSWVTGCSMGAFHSANFFFRHPQHFDGIIAMSGLYSAKEFVGEYADDEVYFNSPLYYLPNLNDESYLERYRQSKIVFSVGQGDWEGPMVHDTQQIERILKEKNVPAWIDYWGHDVNHDWPWWRRQLPFFLGHMLHDAEFHPVEH